MQTRVAVRVASIPVSALENLRADKSWATLSQVAGLGRWLAEEGSGLADDLYPLIGDEGNAVVKSRLVALRRALFGRRRIPSAVWAEEVRATLPAELADRVDHWSAQYAERERLLAELPATLEEETERQAEGLRAALAEPAFGHGLVQGSPVLFEELAKWLDGPPDRPPGRQAVLRLVKYLARVVAKTSPYSTFTISGWAGVDEESAAPYRYTGDFAWTSVSELNAWVLTALNEAVAARPALLRSTRVRVNPSLVSHGGVVRFLSPAPMNPLVTTRPGEAFDTCVRFVGEYPGATVDEVCAHLRRIDPELGAEETERFVGKLIGVGALSPLAGYRDQDEDHLEGLAGALDADPSAAPYAAELRALHRDLLGYPSIADPRERLTRQREIYAGVERLTAPGRLAIKGRLPRKNLFHENAVFTRPVLEYGRTAWRPVLDELAGLRALLGAVDAMLPTRQAMARVFSVCHGPEAGVDWLDFYQLINRLTAEGAETVVPGLDAETLRTLRRGPVGWSPQTWRALPFAREQAAMKDRVTDLILATSPDPDGVVRLPAERLIEALGAGDGPGLRDSVTCYVQLVGEGEHPRVVLNGVTGGYGRGQGRLARLMRQAGGEDPPGGFAPVTHAPGGGLLADSDGLFGSNLNLRARCCEYELDYPFITSAREDRFKIPLNDLVVTLDQDSGFLALGSRSRGVRVHPTHPGVMAEFWLPPPVRDLLAVFGPPASLLHASMPLFVPQGDDPRDGGVRMLPRLESGRITLSRRCWVFPAREMPRRGKGEEDTRYWLRITEWLTGQQIPERFYIRVMGFSETVFKPDMKSRKPVYVDLTVWPLVALLERMIADGGDLVVVTEAHPDLAQAPVYGTERHVTEFMVELPAVPDGEVR
ncbi:lantibiotic dehydratase [Rhizohabitans arisaemae]|uniref:lantibiotic dehydratase n=1 Tax=Rhizohabitans arisaemae TaxID=2720610 RepID=UPI0024B14E4F|nr:lantibiotic dehydratase [Rhizohabitans arisaemae]